MRKDSLKILQVLPSLKSGGVERGTLEISDAIISAGYKSFVCSAGGQLVKSLEDHGAKHIALPVDSKNPLIMIYNVLKLKKIIEDNDISVIHARSRAPAWSCYFAAKLAGIPFVTTFHGTYNIQNAIKLWYNSIMLKGDAVIAVSNYIKKHIETRYHFFSENLHVIHRGADLKYFNPKLVNAARVLKIREAMDLAESHQSKVIILPARFARWKGHKFLIEALNNIKKLDFKCFLVGDLSNDLSGYVREIKLLIKEHKLEDKVFLKDLISDMPALYSISDIVVSASQEPEAFGRTISEAQAMKCIVITTNLGAPQEMVEDGVNGFVASYKNSAELADAIKKALNLDEKTKASILEAAQKKVIKDYSVEKMSASTLQIYEDLANA